ncbi:MAG: hypothetical protein KatS3mg010_1686 [Acidimicrobiia bacterium]|nr:MAG: hypothetical protein KatS3mg010_1686 [Acidimicrobiia bacterium]
MVARAGDGDLAVAGGERVKVAVVGAGSWGTTVAALVCANAPTVLWVRRPELAERIASTRENATYLPGVRLPDALAVTSSLEAACDGADVVVLGVPSHGTRTVLEEAAPHIRRHARVVSLAKGVEQGTLLRMTEVAAEVLADHERACIGVLTGPNLAKEVAAGQPTASVVATTDEQVAEQLQQLFHSPHLARVHEPGRRGLRDRGRAEERARDRGGDRRRAGLRRQHEGGADDAGGSRSSRAWASRSEGARSRSPASRGWVT